MLEKWRRSSGGQSILRDVGLGVVGICTGELELHHLAVLQVTQAEAARSGDEDVEQPPNIR